VRLFDILFSPDEGNVMTLPETKRRPLLESLLKEHKLTRLEVTPQRLVHSEKDCREAIEWASKIAGSEGAMLKSAEATVTLRETDAMAKVKMIREVRGIVWDMNPVKGSPGAQNFYYAVGPVGAEDNSWAEIIEVEGKRYAKAGRTFNTSVKAKVGDVIRVEVTELLWDESNPKSKRLRGFTPTVIDVTDQPPSTLEQIHGMLSAGELKTTANSDSVAKSVWPRFEILKKTEERFVFGVVLVPNEYDSQGDIYDVEAVRKAAYYYMEEVQTDNTAPPLGLMHQRALAKNNIRVLENYLAPIDMHLEGQFVKQGTWLLAAHVLDNELWAAIKDGRLTGWSMEGSAIAHDLD
jgi:hypothetical protein